MKKIFFLFLIPLLIIKAQSAFPLILAEDTRKGWAVDFNGTNEYMIKNSPTNLDISGIQRLLTATDITFETSVGNWASVNSATLDTSSTWKYAGNKSLKIITNGEWSGCKLPYSNFTALTQDANGIYEKYSLEFWTNLQFTDSVKVVIGDKSITRNISATTNTKFAFNFQITSSTINQDIQVLFKTTGKTNYIDNVSLNKAWDLLINVWVLRNTSDTRWILSTGGGGAGQGLSLYSSGSVAYADVCDLGLTSTVTVTKTFPINTWSLFTIQINKTGNLSLSINGGASSTSSMINRGYIGSVLGMLSVGSFGTGDKWSGYIGQIQITRFTDISQSNVSTGTILNTYKYGIPKIWIGGGAKIVIHYKFNGSDTSTLLYDWSGTGNNLSGTGISQAGDQIKGNYPTK